MTASGVQPSVGDLTVVQIVAYALLLAGSALPVALGMAPDETFSPCALVPVGCALALVLAFHAMWPFRGIPGLGWFSRLFSALLGVVSVGAGWHVLVVGDRFVTYRSASVLWGCLFGILLTVLVIVGFGRQMLRRDRSHLIVTLSRCIISGVCSVSAGGWCFLPMLLLEADRAAARSLEWQYALVAAVVVALVACIGAIGVLWRGDAELVAPRSWIGLALMPVMLAGLPVYLGALGLMFPLNW